MLFQLTVTVGGPGLPVRFPDESYFCHLADSEGRFAVNVSAVEVTPNTEYTCNITNQVPIFDGVQAGNFVTIYHRFCNYFFLLIYSD